MTIRAPLEKGYNMWLSRFYYPDLGADMYSLDAKTMKYAKSQEGVYIFMFLHQ